MTFLDTAAIANMFGVARRTVTDRWSKQPDFPRPARNISRRSKWWRQDEIEAWASRGRNEAGAPPVAG